MHADWDDGDDKKMRLFYQLGTGEFVEWVTGQELAAGMVLYFGGEEKPG